jgi:hypothetical protein
MLLSKFYRPVLKYHRAHPRALLDVSNLFLECGMSSGNGHLEWLVSSAPMPHSLDFSEADGPITLREGRKQFDG